MWAIKGDSRSLDDIMHIFMMIMVVQGFLVA